MEDDDDVWELAMPFVTIMSKGGPHDDAAYCAGWEMGYLAATLEHTDPAAYPLRRTLRAANVPQADLIAMREGLAQRIVSYAPSSLLADAWCVVEFVPAGGQVAA
jgi:hypothetical protein